MNVEVNVSFAVSVCWCVRMLKSKRERGKRTETSFIDNQQRVCYFFFLAVSKKL